MINITNEQKANLNKLADYLDAEPKKSDPEFSMGLYACSKDGGWSEFPENAHKAIECCACGFGPIAGITPEEDEEWVAYRERSFGANVENNLFLWLFNTTWLIRDNTRKGTAKRIRWTLENGVPKNVLDILDGVVKLPY